MITSKSLIGIWEFDPNSNRLIWNDVLVNQYGTDRSSIGNNLFEFWKYSIVENDRARISDEVDEFMQSGDEIMEQEFCIIRQNDQSVRSLKCLVISERNSQGKLLRLIGTSVDVTESKEAERKLRASEEKYRGIIDNMNLGLVEVDVNGHVMFSNKKFHDLTLLVDPSQLVTTNSIEEQLSDNQNLEVFYKSMFEDTTPTH